MAAAVAAAGLQGQIVTASLELANGKRGPAGSAGATLDVKSLTLSGGTAPAQAVYDASGRMTVAPARGIASVTYGPAPGQPTVVNFSPGAQVKQAAWRREGNNRPVLGTTIYADNSATKTLYLRAPGGGLLATQTLNADGTSTSSQYLRDEQRVFGTLPPASGGGASGPVAYRLFDSLGSLRVVAAEGSSAGLIAQLDYDPFGQLVSAMGNSKDAIFAGHGLATDGLLDLNARLYDPKLRALLTTDAAQATNWAYGYAGGDPVNLVDPSGDFPTAALRAAIQRQPWRWGLFAASGLIQLGYWVHSTDFTAIRSNWKGTAADVGEVAASMLIGAGVR
ncbi:MAG: RHS repeat-associated core domain-containing protein, partial [bacterium]